MHSSVNYSRKVYFLQLKNCQSQNTKAYFLCIAIVVIVFLVSNINNEVLVNYITLEEILRSGTSLDQWRDFIIQNNLLTRIQCPHCAIFCDVQTDRIEKKLSDIVFVESSVGMISISKFRSQISLADKKYRLVGLVKHLGMHFTSAVYSQYKSSWLYTDDLKDSCLNYFSLDKMHSSHTTDCFFCSL